jgi:transcriptional regulator EpsA
MQIMQAESLDRCEPHPFESPDLEAGEEDTIEISDPLDDLWLEALMPNLDASLRVHTRAHFFRWTQGLLQSLIGHEVLICALCDGKSPWFRVDSFSTSASDPTIFGELFLQDVSVAQNLIKAWTKRRFRPVVCEAGSGSPFAGSAFAKELERTGATQLFAHGTHDADGHVTSLFTFACAPGSVGPNQAYLSQLVVPFLHSAWVRTQVDRRTQGDDGLKPTVVTTNITSREQEILRWIYLGKSNFEIGAILNISALTVKNHVQKILRKLNVVNRAQAVGKALELRILSP